VRRFQTVKSADRVTFSGDIPLINIEKIQNHLFNALKTKQLMMCYDVDGTLLPYNEGFEVFTEQKIDDFLVMANEVYKANGQKIGVTILTGRSIPQVHKLFQNRLEGEPVCILGEDGGVYYNCLTGEFDTTASPEVPKAIHALRTRLSQQKIEDPHEITQTRLAWFGIPEYIDRLYSQLSNISKSPVLKVKHLYNILQVAPHGFDKANGLLLLANKLRLNSINTFLFHIGDGRNDFPAFGFIRERFENSGIGVLVGRFKPRNTDDVSPPAHGYLTSDELAQYQPKLAEMTESRLLTKTVWWLVERFGDSLREANNRKELKPNK
jgi:hydroxymethylpyrimidine pyrophosphatase-like HAD family hydrolase